MPPTIAIGDRIIVFVPTFTTVAAHIGPAAATKTLFAALGKGFECLSLGDAALAAAARGSIQVGPGFGREIVAILAWILL